MFTYLLGLEGSALEPNVTLVVTFFFFFFHGALRPRKPEDLLGTWKMEVGGRGREIIYQSVYTVTTRMTPALRWAATEAILMFH